MEKELDIEVIKATQTSLGKYVKRPPLTEKLLKKPPFRFLHDIITTVIKTTGFFDGLFENEELVSDNVKDRESKIAFLDKVIAVSVAVTGRTLTVKPSKVVAGQEVEKTNELLQCIAFALDNNLSSEEAVKQYKGVEKPLEANKNDKSKDTNKPVKKATDQKKLTSRSSEKLTSKDVREKSLTRNEKEKTGSNRTNEKSLTRNEKEKSNTTKTKSKDTVSNKKDSPPKKTTQPSKILTKKNSVEKSPSTESDNKTSKQIPVVNTTNNDNDLNIALDKTDQDSGVSLEKQDTIYPKNEIEISAKADNEIEAKLNSSYTIAENELNSSLSSQDLMEVDPNADEIQRIHVNVSGNEVNVKQDSNFENNGRLSKPLDIYPENEDSKKHNKIEEHTQVSTNNAKRRDSNQYEAKDKINSDENISNIVRPNSVRPSSSRPGAPRLRDKHDNMVSGNENLLIGKVNIIIENPTNEEEEDSSIVIVEQQSIHTATQDSQELQLSANQHHGALVQQILDSQKEFSQSSGKTEIEWQFGAQKAREAVSQEVEQLRFNIQALSRVANPLGKMLDHIQEDVEVMRQELQQWTKTYEEASKELQKQKLANEDSLFPLHTKLKQLDTDIEEKHDKINDLKIIIHKNASRIEKLLAGGDVQ